MRELLARTSYAVVIFGCYFLGTKLNPELKNTFVDLDLRLLLPFVSLVYFEYFLKTLDPYFHKVKVLHVTYLNHRAVARIRVNYHGKGVLPLALHGIRGVEDVNVSLMYTPTQGEETRTLAVPEHYRTHLTPSQQFVEFDLIFEFRSEPAFCRMPNPMGYLYKRRYLKPVIVLRLGNSNRSVSCWIFEEASYGQGTKSNA